MPVGGSNLTLPRASTTTFGHRHLNHRRIQLSTNPSKKKMFPLFFYSYNPWLFPFHCQYNHVHFTFMKKNIKINSHKNPFTSTTTIQRLVTGFGINKVQAAGHHWGHTRGQLSNHAARDATLNRSTRPSAVCSGLSHTVCKQGGAWAQGKCVTLTECSL